MKTVIQAFRKHWVVIAIFCVLLTILLTNTFHEEYPDEYDSLSGGRYIMMGKIPYKDWFQHHQPGAYVLGGIIYHFSGQSFVHFRIGLAFAYFSLFLLAYLMIRERVGEKESKWFLLFLLITAVGATYFWGQMLLADSLSSYFLIPAFALVLLKVFQKKPLELPDLVIISIYTFLCWFTSMTTSLLIAPLIGYAALSFFVNKIHKINKTAIKTIGMVSLIFLIPYVLYFSFFLATGSIKEWYFDNVTYNSNYYIYNYPRPYGTPINPVRYAIVLAQAFFDNYFPALSGVSQLPLGDPLQATLALSGTALIIYLILSKRYGFVIPYVLLLIYTCARNNPQSIKETDYQSLLYATLMVSSGILLIGHTKHVIDERLGTPSEQLVAKGLFIILLIFWSFSTYFLALKWSLKVYAKYMGTAPLIYDRPEVAPILNKVLTKDDYAWVGPFEFKELFYLNTKVPSKYHWFLDHAVHSDKMRTEILSDFENHPAKVIVFRRDYSPWGGKASDFNYFFTDYLDKNYIRVFEYNETLTGYWYQWKTSHTEKFDLDGTVHLRKANITELLDKLVALGYLEKKNK
jgi:hypothetical protein